MIDVSDVSDDEIAQRVTALREILHANRFDAALLYGAHRDYQPADLRYFARWYCVEEETACLVVPARGRTTLVTDAVWDLDRAREEARADEFAWSGDLAAQIVELLRSTNPPVRKVGIAGFRFFPAPTFLKLTAAFPDCAFEDFSTHSSALRMIKSDAEIRIMREASRISDAAMEAGLARVADGVTEAEVAAAAENVIRSAGAEPSFVTEMGAGPRTALGTFLPGRRPLKNGEVAVLDCGARVYGYHGDMCRTVVVGGADAKQAAMLVAVARSNRAAIEAVRPGVTVGALRDMAAKEIEDSGFGAYWWDAFMPHGNGTGQHERPNAKDDPDLAVAAGMVLCIEPGIMVPGIGAYILEQMIAVTDAGAEVLNRLPLEMWQLK